MIIDLNGLPGSGKSTVVNDFTQSNQQFELKGTEEFIKLSKLQKISLLRLLIDTKNRKFFFLIGKLGKKNTSTAKGIGRYERLIARLYSLYVFQLIQESQVEKKNYIFDEGIIQSLVPITLGFELDIEVLKKFSKLLVSIDFLFVHCEISETESFSRIVKRNRQTAAMDFLTNNELQTFLQTYALRLSEIREILCRKDHGNLWLDMQENPVFLSKQIEMVLKND
ncbi:TPA: AAA family ATPase [Streptococcus suis]